MTKQEFTDQLRAKLQGLPESELEERILFYSEMIDDRIEDGVCESDAVDAVGDIDDISRQILSEVPLTKIVKEKVKARRKLAAWEIVLLSVGSPLWLSLLVVAFAVLIVIYAVIWSLVAVAWAVFASLAACAPTGILLLVILCSQGNIAAGLAMLGAGLVCAGLALLSFIGAKEATRGIAILTKTLALLIKKPFVRGGKQK